MVEEEKFDGKFEDAESFRGKQEGGSFKEMVLRRYDRCATELSKEMTLGGIQRRIVNGQVVEVMCPNQVEISINSIRTLWDKLYSYRAKYCKVMKPYQQVYDGLPELEKEYYAKKKKLKEEFDCIERKKSSDYTSFSRWQQEFCQELEFLKLEQFRKLFEGLGVLLYEMRYLEEKGADSRE